MTVIASIETTLAHQVRLVHTATGQRIPITAPALLSTPFGWRVRVAGDEAVVVVPTGQPAVTPAPRLQMVVADGVLADLLDLPPLDPDQEPRSVRVPLTAAEIEVPVPPVKMTLTVVLTAAGTGDPSTGRMVTVRGTPGPAIPLPETVEPGTYRSAAIVWDRKHTPGDLRVGTTSVRKVGVDVRRTDTRVHVIDPT
ncbi:hypothetical protein D0Z08_30155 [Nocardioides immobilis]|uniref:Uncharacterized protein n=1 Tax=Nocardioides immobilis TaxID=2049295 RepID=A0A417XSS9_9ACTN|nr:hypothetical protein [Nocardioides immobilis]RHW23355.1 hypothetical protein D0Z08_30155 [Nocardioides immobilis]